MLEVAAPPPVTAAAPSPSPPPAAHGLRFADVLSALNPLQYLPVIGTIYRAVTGDQVPEPVRRIGSLIVSGLLGGPIGIGINLATLAAEKASGIDLDQTGQALLAGDPPAAPAPAPDAPAVAATFRAWSPTQLAAYGVTVQADGTLTRGELSGADLLNTLELGRIQGAQLAYSRAMTLAG